MIFSQETSYVYFLEKLFLKILKCKEPSEKECILKNGVEVGMATISRQIGCHKDTLRNHFKKYGELGLVKKHGGGRGKKAYYSIPIENIPDFIFQKLNVRNFRSVGNTYNVYPKKINKKIDKKEVDNCENYVEKVEKSVENKRKLGLEKKEKFTGGENSNKTGVSVEKIEKLNAGAKKWRTEKYKMIGDLVNKTRATVVNHTDEAIAQTYNEIKCGKKQLLMLVAVVLNRYQNFFSTKDAGSWRNAVNILMGIFKNKTGDECLTKLKEYLRVADWVENYCNLNPGYRFNPCPDYYFSENLQTQTSYNKALAACKRFYYVQRNCHKFYTDENYRAKSWQNQKAYLIKHYAKPYANATAYYEKMEIMNAFKEKTKKYKLKTTQEVFMKNLVNAFQVQKMGG